MSQDVIVAGTGIETVEYRDIPGCPGYRADSDGTIWSRRHSNGVLKKPRQITGCVRHYGGKGPQAGQPKVLLVSLSFGRNGNNRTFYAGRLILLTFVGPCPPRMECCHNDGNPLNNRLDNLRWGTRRSNIDDKISHGRNHCGHPFGEANSQVKLTTVKVVGILLAHAGGDAISVIAQRAGVTRDTVEAILRGERWSHLKLARPKE